MVTSCAKTITNTEIKYILPDIPETMLDPCKEVEIDIQTNGDLLISLINLQAAYLECSSKVSSVSTILNSYKNIYSPNVQADLVEN